MVSLNSLVRTSARASVRVGRGGKRGKTAGRGTKGQNARAGRKKRPEWRDIIKKLPLRRGFGKNRARTVNALRPQATTITLTKLSAVFPAGSEVNAKTLAAHDIVRVRGKRLPFVKIVGSGEITKALKLSGIPVSASAKAAIEKAGGSVA